jgi:pimeloyl-ACP methyl ester carboxylesterase
MKSLSQFVLYRFLFVGITGVVLSGNVQSAFAQEPAYVNSLPADPPYYRVRYAASPKPGELAFPASFTVWIPPGLKTLRGLVVHQHGCGEGSCKSGLTGAFDLHWQALAKEHGCALISPVYEQPEMANCHLWCDPRNGSDVVFQKSLTDLGAKSGHPELATVPWALWGHSGGGYWVGGMALLHPDRVAAAWLRSGVPPVTAVEGKPTPYVISEAACGVPMMCNLGTKEGFTDKEGRFAGVWPGVEVFFLAVRAKQGLIGVSIDPISSHDCGNQRYLAMPWFDACLTARLPGKSGDPLKAMPTKDSWLAPFSAGNVNGQNAKTGKGFAGYANLVIDQSLQDKYVVQIEKTVWLPNESIAYAWMEYSKDTQVFDNTPPPAPTALKLAGNVLTWSADADLESGLAHFIIERDGKFLTNVPEQGKNPFGRPVYQNLSYSDTPTQPLVEMRFVDSKAEAGKAHKYRVIAVNTVGLKSE